MSVFTPLLKLSILLGANKKYQQPTEKFRSSLQGCKNPSIFLIVITLTWGTELCNHFAYQTLSAPYFAYCAKCQ